MSLRSPNLRSRAWAARAVLALAVCLPAVATATTAPFRPAPQRPGPGLADPAEGRRILQEFRQAGLAGSYALVFELQVLPRKGQERSLRGRLYGMRDAAGPLTRLELAGQRWLIRSGPNPAAWCQPAPDRPVQSLGVGETLAPLAGTDLTLFDLQMPFLYWEDHVYEGLAKIRGRPAHRFLLYPPPAPAPAPPGLTAVRIALDTQFQALVQAELLGPQGEPEQTITVLDLKKTGDQWLVQAIDLRNHRTRDKTRFAVREAALSLALPPAVFTPAGLAAAPAELAALRLEPL